MDMTIMHAGTVEAVMDIMKENRISLTEPVDAGTEFVVPANTAKDENTLRYLLTAKRQIGTKSGLY